MTEAESRLWQDLQILKRDGFHFRKQAPIGQFIVDFVCHGRKLIIELDGGYHTEDNQLKADNLRQDWLQSQGYKVLRFWNDDIYKHSESVFVEIETYLKG